MLLPINKNILYYFSLAQNKTFLLINNYFMVFSAENLNKNIKIIYKTNINNYNKKGDIKVDETI